MNVPALSVPTATAPGNSASGSSTKTESPFGDLVEAFVAGQSCPESGVSDQVATPIAEPVETTEATAGETEPTTNETATGNAIENHDGTDTMTTGQESLEDEGPVGTALDDLALALAALLGVQTSIRPVLVPVPANAQPGSAPTTGATTDGATEPAFEQITMDDTTSTVPGSPGATRPSPDLPPSGVEATPSPGGLEALQPSVGPDAPGATSTVQQTSNGPLVDVRPLAPSTAAAAVHRQVFPEVARLVSAGNGTHRMMLRLDPGSLGEVRITLTVRGGAVRVSLTAGHEASNALLDGASELRRLLERSGADDARVTVRELTARPTAHVTSAEISTRHPATDQAGGGLSNDAGRFERETSGGSAGTPDPHARTREDTTATDGTGESTSVSHPVHPDTSTRTAGLDVTM